MDMVRGDVSHVMRIRTVQEVISSTALQILHRLLQVTISQIVYVYPDTLDHHVATMMIPHASSVLVAHIALEAFRW